MKCLYWTIVLVLHAVTGQVPCSVGRDCPRDMCCLGSRKSQGYCAPLKSVGVDCQMYSGIESWGQTPWKVHECRCLNGLYCGSDDPYAPLGSRGTCRSNRFA
ncbi:uncharacterized protein LOC124133449 [Haliotis rufescens]|uniref:uncharacterized protein LOC124133449 n=1 Tax=Haliotis rufescens TaxID=6454 RepID=UPI00201E7B1B|nr:uncharacterized protein LOC124133449 [Haliotis rufescens]